MFAVRPGRGGACQSQLQPFPSWEAEIARYNGSLILPWPPLPPASPCNGSKGKTSSMTQRPGTHRSETRSSPLLGLFPETAPSGPMSLSCRCQMSALTTKAQASPTEGLHAYAEQAVTAVPAAQSSISSPQLSPCHEPDPAGQVQTAARGQQVLPGHPRHGASVHHPALRRESEIPDQGACLSVAIVGQGQKAGEGQGGCPGGPLPLASASSIPSVDGAGQGFGGPRTQP